MRRLWSRPELLKTAKGARGAPFALRATPLRCVLAPCDGRKASSGVLLTNYSTCGPALVSVPRRRAQWPANCCLTGVRCLPKQRVGLADVSQ